MPFSRYEPTTRIPSERTVLRNNQFARYVSKRTGVSSQALTKAIQLLSNGIIEALGDGFEVSLIGIGTFEVRELKPRKRFHRIEKRMYISEPSMIVHFKKSEQLTKRVRQAAEGNLESMATKTTINPSTR